ncbi:MAG TPA: aspartate aminotransferase family protein [Firmicutes bacterium]|nr:aspartate aminotransferase family protein [Bacillota bacterium]
MERSIIERYRERFAESARLYEEARGVFPAGVTHDGRYLLPFPPYVVEAKGAYKWTVEGHRLIDYGMGHGALLFGHADPQIVRAVQEQVAKGTHYAACHPAEIEWGRLVQTMVPGAERVRFTASGTEATLMALRLARSFTGRRRILKFEGHFHGWHDYATAGVMPPYAVPSATGIPEETLSTVRAVPPDLKAVEEALRQDREVAAVILEPNGASWGTQPLPPGFHAGLRRLCDRYGVLLIFDEVVAGFRLAPGGGQEYYGVRADLMAFAKVLAGGLPGGCVAGRAEILDLLAYHDDPEWDRFRKISHPGTFNANPLSAAAGIACLRRVATGEPTARAGGLGRRAIRLFNGVLDELGLAGCFYGEGSLFHLVLGLDCPERRGEDTTCGLTAERLAQAPPPAYLMPLHQAMLLEGVHLFSSGGILSTAHTEEDLEFTAEALRRALGSLKEEGLLPPG